MNFVKFYVRSSLWSPVLKNIQNYSQVSSSQRKFENENIRIRLAAAYRGLDKYGLNEGICNHLSAIAPSSKINDDVMLIIPHGLHWNEVRPSSLIAVDRNNDVVEGDRSPELTALCIHRGIYDKRPDLKSVMHTHMPYATALTCLKKPELLMLHQNSARFYNRIAYDTSYGGLGTSLDEGLRLGEVLGDKDILFMGNHGVVIAGDTIDVAFDNMYYLERAAMIQVLACGTNREVRELNQETVELTSKQIWHSVPKYAESHLNTIIRQLSTSCSEFNLTLK